MYYIDKDFLGTKEHVIVSGTEISFSCAVPSGTLIENGTSLPGTLQAYLNLIGKERSLVPPEVRESCDVCKIPIDLIGLQHLLRPEEFATELAEFNHDIKDLIADTFHYISMYVTNVKTLNSCVPFTLKHRNTEIKTTSLGYTHKITYDTSVTKTGRMSVTSGPNVLTMQKQFKSDIASRFDDGKIVEIDYSSLEPRVALAIAGSEFVESPDVYSTLGDVIEIHDRSVAKQLIISFLYGAGIKTMCRLTELSESNLTPKLKKLKKIFKQDLIVENIKGTLGSLGYFYNHAGRPIFPTSDRFGVLFNNFCQSTAVDVSLSGFSHLLSSIYDSNMKARPICFIHDAVLLDVPGTEIAVLKKMSEKLPTYLGVDFPTKLTIVG